MSEGENRPSSDNEDDNDDEMHNPPTDPNPPSNNNRPPRDSRHTEELDEDDGDAYEAKRNREEEARIQRKAELARILSSKPLRYIELEFYSKKKLKSLIFTETFNLNHVLLDLQFWIEELTIEEIKANHKLLVKHKWIPDTLKTKRWSDENYAQSLETGHKHLLQWLLKNLTLSKREDTQDNDSIYRSYKQRRDEESDISDKNVSDSDSDS